MNRRLNTCLSVRKYLGDIIRRVERDEIPLKKAETLTRLANALLIALRSDEIENQLSIYEEEIAKRGKR